ncbi:MAG: isopentenyl-diphosphate Delta-isomerase [Bacteroidetes bacterium]|nr:isopentenyl-diphosphate Delta-isomerase [Bacteroidota bacterium]
MEQVILVDEHDVLTGTMEKMAAHEKAVLHRAFSVFVFNAQGEMLLQQRAKEKYHSGGLWTNSCCSHPRPGEETRSAATRRLREELGFETPLEKIFDFVYKADFDNGLTEYEFDHVFVGYYDGEINPDKKEVSDYVYLSMQQIADALQTEPATYTAWFHIAFPKVLQWWKQLQPAS